MKTLILAAIRCSLIFTAVAALSLAYPASVQAVPTTYRYTGNPFTDVSGPYTTSDFVTAMVTLAGPLGANMPLTEVTPTAFTLSDGVQTISNTTPDLSTILQFATNARGEITVWDVEVARHELITSISHIHDVTASQRRQLDIGLDGETASATIEHARGVEPGHRHAGRGVYPIIDDADPYGVGSSGPAVPAGSGLTAPGLAEVASWRSATRPASNHPHQRCT